MENTPWPESLSTTDTNNWHVLALSQMNAWDETLQVSMYVSRRHLGIQSTDKDTEDAYKGGGLILFWRIFLFYWRPLFASSTASGSPWTPQVFQGSSKGRRTAHRPQDLIQRAKVIPDKASKAAFAVARLHRPRPHCSFWGALSWAGKEEVQKNKDVYICFIWAITSVVEFTFPWHRTWVACKILQAQRRPSHENPPTGSESGANKTDLLRGGNLAFKKGL